MELLFDMSITTSAPAEPLFFHDCISSGDRFIFILTLFMTGSSISYVCNSTEHLRSSLAELNTLRLKNSFSSNFFFISIRLHCASLSVSHTDKTYSSSVPSNSEASSSRKTFDIRQIYFPPSFILLSSFLEKTLQYPTTRESPGAIGSSINSFLIKPPAILFVLTYFPSQTLFGIINEDSAHQEARDHPSPI